QSLAEHYSETPSSLRETWYETYRTLSQTADSLQIAYNDTQWVEARSGSRRQNRYTPIGGLIGRVRWEGEISPLLPWLLWGQSLHVGKNAVKGNGWYRIIKKL
ncbi:MAG: CRISPR system precrRNA processing endoribonuclease RAMP protein Cas6, partial [Anaerolineae bacterium]|nr:CRISPR system precrRNA processing endoribonuclease RAMP protein Cas6 [Anaerolineae bacterium]